MTENGGKKIRGIKNVWYDRVYENTQSDSRVEYIYLGDGGWVMPEYYAKNEEKIKNFQVYEDDVWVITFPKCGTTWTQEMVWYLINNFDYEQGKTLLTDRFPFLELSLLKENQKYGNTLEKAQNLRRPRTIKTHLPKELLPPQIWTVRPKIIYCARDPKDAALSYYYQEKRFGYDGTKDNYFEAFSDDVINYCPFWKHILDFWEMREEPNILFNCFEEMKSDLPRIIQRTARFLGKSLSQDQLNKLAHHLDFDQMKENKSVPYDLGKKLSDLKFMRKGIVGDHVNYMSEEIIAKFNKKMEEALKGTNYIVGHSGGHQELNN